MLVNYDPVKMGKFHVKMYIFSRSNSVLFIFQYNDKF